MGNTFSFVGGDQAIADDDGWLVSIQIEDWDERFLGEVSLQLSELDTADRRDSFARRGGGREVEDDVGVVDGCDVGGRSPSPRCVDTRDGAVFDRNVAAVEAPGVVALHRPRVRCRALRG